MKYHTARFWVYHGGAVRGDGYHPQGLDDYGLPRGMAGGWVKLSLCTGDKLVIHSGGPHDEGYSYTTKVYSYRNGTVYCESTTRARDCDGPLDTYINTAADIHSRHRPDHYFDAPEGVEMLSFAKLSHRQRDYYAEAMGY